MNMYYSVNRGWINISFNNTARWNAILPAPFLLSRFHRSLSPLYPIAPLCFTLSRFVPHFLFFLHLWTRVSHAFLHAQTDTIASQPASQGGCICTDAYRIFPDTYLNVQVWTSRTSGTARWCRTDPPLRHQASQPSSYCSFPFRVLFTPR